MGKHAMGALVSTMAMLLLAACSHTEAPPAAPRPVLVEQPQPLEGESGEVFPGTVRARVETALSFRVPGKIISRRVNAGDAVQPGQVLASLDPQDARLNTDSAQANVAAAEADVRLAEADLARQKEMLDRGFISKSLYDVSDNKLKLAQARAEQARSSFAVVRNQAGYTSIVADRAGTITGVLAESGQVVTAGQPVMSFAAQGEREAVIHVPEGRVDAFRKAPLAVTLWAKPGVRYAARLREINMQADAATRTHEARVTILEPDADVKLGMTATVLMGARMDAAAFGVPLSALGALKEQPVLWTVEGGKLKSVPVKVLRYIESAAIVSGALSPQTPIVTAGVQLMVEGAPATPVQRQREGAPTSSAP